MVSHTCFLIFSQLLKGKLLRWHDPFLSSYRFFLTYFCHVNSYVLIKKCSTGKRACTVTAAKRPLVYMRFNVCPELCRMRKCLITVRTGIVFTAAHSVTVMKFELFSI